jgi:hypothetical protein
MWSVERMLAGLKNHLAQLRICDRMLERGDIDPIRVTWLAMVRPAGIWTT